MKYANEMQKCQYYCPIFNHTMTFVIDETEKICKTCGVKISKPEKSVYDINQIKRYKFRYQEFLKRKEGM